MAHGGDIYRNRVKHDFSVNVNPFGPPDAVIESIREQADMAAVYPDEWCDDLCRAIALREGVGKDEVLCGNGASELIMSIIYAHRPKRALLTAPAFSEYERALQACGCTISYYYLKKEFDFYIQQDYMEMITEDLDMVILCEPLNPAGVVNDAGLLGAIACRCRECGCTLVMDASFLPFTEKEKKVKEAVGKDGVLWLSSFTKLYAIPGVRLGYVLCDSFREKERIRKAQPAWSVSVLAMAAGMAALGQEEYLRRSLADIRKEREYLRRELEKAGLTVFPSEANFLLVHCSYPLYEILLKEQILIRDCSDYRGLEPGYYRIAVRRHEENRALAGVLKPSLEVLVDN